MSYPGVSPSDTIEETNPVGAQDVSEGVSTPQNTEYKEEDFQAAVKKAMEDTFKISEQWTSHRKVVRFIIDCPSGQKALVKHLDTWDLIDNNLIEELDFFTRKLFPGFNQAGNPVEDDGEEGESFWAAMRKPEKRTRFLDMTGILIAASSIKPKVIHDGVAVIVDPETGAQKTVFGHEMTIDEQLEHFKRPVPKLEDGQTYSGTIDFSDRMKFFQELNKPLAVIQPFREESSDVLQDLARIQGLGDTTE